MTLLDTLKSPIGVGFYHPNKKEKSLMADLQSCLSKEAGFKKITQDMMTPPLIIDTFYERPSYPEWSIGLASVLICLIFIGIVIELYRHLKNKKKHNGEAVTGEMTIKNDIL